MKKNIIILLFLLVVIFGLLCIYVGKPIKKAVTEPRYNNYIICSETRVTDFWWEMEIEGTPYTEHINIVNDEEIRTKNVEFLWQCNRYYIYGHFIEKNEFGKVFMMEDWDIIYPVKHSTFLSFLSKMYLYECDMR